jgi:hypothetical protein
MNISGIAATKTGHGYRLVGLDGGVFGYGDAHFAGSLPGLHVAVNDVIGIASTSDNGGYWLGEGNGGVFAFGTAHFLGSLGNAHLVDPIVGISS